MQEIASHAVRAQSVGRAWDDGERATQNNDMTALAAARDKLRKLGATEESNRLVRAKTKELVIRASVFDAQGYRAAGAEQKILQNQAAKLYRQALQLDPDFSSPHPDLLNQIGYFLADKGQSKSDFMLAEKLTRRALAGIENKDANAFSVASDAMQRANTRDSLAWALFRQGRFAEALREQRQAVKEAESLTQDDDELRELRSHLRQIEQAAASTAN